MGGSTIEKSSTNRLSASMHCFGCSGLLLANACAVIDTNSLYRWIVYQHG
jgi:hypothetical protein